jgi:hypothetical protein
VQQCTFLIVAKDTASLYFVFAEGPGGTAINYRDFSPNGRLDLQTIVHQVRIEIGEVAWAFSTPLNASNQELEAYPANSGQYVNTTLQTQNKPGKRISEEAVSSPEIASKNGYRPRRPVESKNSSRTDGSCAHRDKDANASKPCGYRAEYIDRVPRAPERALLGSTNGTYNTGPKRR